MNTKKSKQNKKDLNVIDTEINTDNEKVRTECENKFS